MFQEFLIYASLLLPKWKKNPIDITFKDISTVNTTVKKISAIAKNCF
jgi:hypothetical protein